MGFGSKLVLDTIEFFGGVLEGGASLIYAGDFWYGYNKFKEETVEPLTQAVREWVTDEEAYEFGTGVAIGFEIFEAGKGIYKLTSIGVNKIVGKIKGTVGATAKTIEAGSGSTKMNVIENDIIGKERIGSALKTDSYHNFNDIIDNYAGLATKTKINNGTLYQLEGALNGIEGRFEWIIQGENVTHRMFVPGGKINGLPIKP